MEDELDYVELAVAEFKDGLGWFAERLPEVGRQFISYANACFQDGELSELTKHLIALGIAVQIQDEYCILFHGQNALRLGATEKQILETLGVCGAFGGGAALSQAVTLVRDLFDSQSRVEAH
ncbi:3-dehydroquinate dehydratase, type II [Alicyclobacillus hesperidum URH17-3-68]|uniref:Carboxymuconolactone decarboxylase-like domain-containing protein n=1 Tax=Alicyclobacillus hesperidum TaxID=89784 RepID=A0AA37U716_9BACL|nr:carboxymuconolactone decarboxylase family protein [Alicyclobacillus hesperidum]EJY56198.1 3-dehydroquinate dehydratase, type II [Alicyclobacillus hesperidum URH17-3-68]GLV14794.1 hypothetical protein Heshes_24780 [Alicyclobacillus hesperidum]